MASTSPVDPHAAVSLRSVTKYYGAVHAVDGVDLDIARGEIFGLIGHNGAGKSTLFKIMLGLEAATKGDIVLGGAPVRGRGFRAARRHIGYLPENVVLYDNLSGLETLRFFARLKHVPLQQCPGMLESVGLAHAGKRPVREYSKGMRQRLGLYVEQPQGVRVTDKILYQAPFKGPMYIEFGDEKSRIALREEEAQFIIVETLS